MQTVRIDLQSNRVTIIPKRGREFPLTSIPEQVESAGFTPDDMYIVARGTVVKQKGSTRFRIENWQRSYPLRMEDPPEGTVTVRADVHFERDPPLLTEREKR